MHGPFLRVESTSQAHPQIPARLKLIVAMYGLMFLARGAPALLSGLAHLDLGIGDGHHPDPHHQGHGYGDRDDDRRGRRDDDKSSDDDRDDRRDRRGRWRRRDDGDRSGDDDRGRGGGENLSLTVDPPSPPDLSDLDLSDRADRLTAMTRVDQYLRALDVCNEQAQRLARTVGMSDSSYYTNMEREFQQLRAQAVALNTALDNYDSKLMEVKDLEDQQKALDDEAARLALDGKFDEAKKVLDEANALDGKITAAQDAADRARAQISSTTVGVRVCAVTFKREWGSFSSHYDDYKRAYLQLKDEKPQKDPDPSHKPPPLKGTDTSDHHQPNGNDAVADQLLVTERSAIESALNKLDAIRTRFGTLTEHQQWLYDELTKQQRELEDMAYQAKHPTSRPPSGIDRKSGVSDRDLAALREKAGDIQTLTDSADREYRASRVPRPRERPSQS